MRLPPSFYHCFAWFISLHVASLAQIVGPLGLVSYAP